MPEVHPHDHKWVNNQLNGLPDAFKKRIMEEYVKQPTRQASNLSILNAREAIAEILGKDKRFYTVNVEDRDRCLIARRRARNCLTLFIESNKQLIPAYHSIIHFLSAHNIAPKPLNKDVREALATGTLNEMEALKVRGVINRAMDERWWQQKLAVQHGRQIESVARHINLVNKQRGIYISDISKALYDNQRWHTQNFLQETIATNEDGFSKSLAELSSLNVSNPKIRHAELMVRMRGFEEYAESRQYSALFLTMTCPSKYHRAFSKSGAANPTWGGATPLDGQKYLCSTFARIRAEMKRQAIAAFGFRVAEPHHEGTPHWHLLLFLKSEQQQTLIDIFQHYCFEEDGDEKGAAEHRFTVKHIDPRKGSATGYIAKYISKNIDGEGIDEDSYGEDAKTSAIRVRAWASCWGIRQFQQIGGAGVTPWRELRRIKAISENGLEWIEEIRQAADQSDWQRYTELMGGVFCKRDEQTIRPLYQQQQINKQNPECIPANPAMDCRNPAISAEISPEMTLEPSSNPVPEIQQSIQKHAAMSCTNAENMLQAAPETSGNFQQCKTNRYGDEVLTRIKGIVSFGVEVITRAHEWTLSRSVGTNRSNLEFCQ
ncbi:replication endonuclease [Shewanella sp. C32]|uniref:Replication endonuclease n=1 Tax=Shewanella electrica TaxID=515560 RepID=A0ABT2FJC4_9GAMM|nr:replication endonuclease [Shewanella electrica]MCH1924536.1 replication endonuclease [Shewanella electrica]MCS4556437.1 replication endonuclease [Shewanella electrica]